MATVILLLVVIAFVYRVSTAEERARVARLVWLRVRGVAEYGHDDLEPFETALRTRTSHAFVTLALAALNVGVFLCMAFGKGALADPATAINWGASFGPQTTHGEAWRFATAMFVHAGVLSLIVEMAALLQIGRVVERLVGPLAFLATYLVAGLVAAVVNLATFPVAIGDGASGAVFGVYGLLLACVATHTLPRARLAIPAVALVRFAPVTIVFAVYCFAAAPIGVAAAVVGSAAGAISGVALSSWDARRPTTRRAAIVAATGLAVAVAMMISVRGVTDIRPEIARLVAVEHQTATTYETAASKLSKGRTSAEALADLIERTIVPQLEAADARMTALDGVPREEASRLAAAQEYARLRAESWRLRAEGLRDLGTPVPATPTRGSTETFRARAEAHYRAAMATFGKAETYERAALAALHRISL